MIGSWSQVVNVLESRSALEAQIKRCGATPLVLYFRAEWMMSCKQMDAVVDALAKEHSNVSFWQARRCVGVIANLLQRFPSPLDTYGFFRRLAYGRHSASFPG
jgi:hypothetical protein